MREKLPSTANKRQTLRVLICARTFPNKNQLGLGISIAENNGVPVFMKLSASAFAQVLANPQERVALDFFSGIEE